MSLRKVSFTLAIVLVAFTISECGWTRTTQAQGLLSFDNSPTGNLPCYTPALLQGQSHGYQQPESVINRLNIDNTDLALANYSPTSGSGLLLCNWEADALGSGCGVEPDCCGTSGSCQGCWNCWQCPIKPAPCIECPRVTTLSPYFNMQFFGALKLDMLFSEARTVGPGTPFFLATAPTPGFKQNTVSIHARQSTLGAAFTGPQFCGLQSGGMIIAMFYDNNVIADRYGLLPLQAYGDLKNNDWRFAAGLQFDVFNPRAPTVLPFSILSASGNTGNAFRGQLRLERFLHPANDAQWTLQFALSEPIVSTIDPQFRISEDNGWPNVEGRIALGIGQLEPVGAAAVRPFEIGVSGIVGQLRTSVPLIRQVVTDVWGLGVDGRWKITRCFGIAGEVYTGQALGTYNGAILQTINLDNLVAVNSTLEGIRSTGGWLETFYYWTPRLHSHVGYGVDDPEDDDVGSVQRTFNSTIFANMIWDVNQTFRIGCEFTWRETEHKDVPVVSDINKGAGFHTQFQWAF